MRFATTEDTVVNADAAAGVLANDDDPDGGGDSKTVVAVNGLASSVGSSFTLPSGATLQLDADGSFAYDPAIASTFQALGTGQSGTDAFTYTIQTGAGVQSTATVTIGVSGVNDAPVPFIGSNLPSYTENAVPVVLAPGFSVTDPDDTALAFATVQFVASYQNGQDVLGFTAQPGIMGNWDSATGSAHARPGRHRRTPSSRP